MLSGKEYLYICRDPYIRDAVIRLGPHCFIYGKSLSGKSSAESSIYYLNKAPPAIGFLVESNSQFNLLERNGLSRTTATAIGFISKVNQLKDGSLTQLPVALVNAMGPPIALPLRPTFSYNPPLESNYNVKANFSYCEKRNLWIDSRGTISHIGPKYRKLIAGAGRRMALTSPGFRRRINNNISLNYYLKSVSGTTAAKPGNYFLYSQPLRAYNPYIEQWFDITWLGLASCMTFADALKNASLSHFDRVLYSQCVNDSIKIQREGARSPFQRLANNQKKNVQFSEEEWHAWRKKTLNDFTTESNPTILKHINSQNYLENTPLNILVKRLRKQQAEKQNELDCMLEDLKKSENELKEKTKDTTKRYSKIRLHQLAIQENENAIPALQTNITRLKPKIAQRRMILNRIIIQTEKKNTQYENLKQKYLIQFENDPNKLDYAAGLFASGIVIDELWYKNSETGRSACASIDPEITIDPAWTLCKAEMHTTKPIPIIFGLSEKGLAPRVSGPHKIVARISEDNEVYVKISALAPWSCCGFTGDKFKPYPHTPWERLNLDSANAYSDKLQQLIGVCMGELAPNAAAAFRNNSPKQLALALLSYLQSTDPDDAYGESYIHFPLLSELIEKESIGKYHNYKQPPNLHPVKYCINPQAMRYIELSLKSTNAYYRWGDLEYNSETEQYKEITSCNSLSIHCDYYNYVDDYVLNQWVGQPYQIVHFVNILPATPECPSPTWHPQNGENWSIASNNL